MFRPYGIVGKDFVSKNNVRWNIVNVPQELLKGDHHWVSEISEVRVIFHFLRKNIAWIDYARNVFDFNIFQLMAFSYHIYRRFIYLIPFEVTEAAHWTTALLWLYILVREYASRITISLARCLSDWISVAHSLVAIISASQELNAVWFLADGFPWNRSTRAADEKTWERAEFEQF